MILLCFMLLYFFYLNPLGHNSHSTVVWQVLEVQACKAGQNRVRE